MSKTYITNCRESFENALKHSVDAGFVNYNQYINTNVNLVAFNKLKIKNENCVTFDSGHISVSGTFIYKNEIGCIGLTRLYSDFNGSIESIRDEIIGNYLITIIKDSVLYILGDSSDIFDIFFYKDENSWIVSNDLQSIVREKKENVKLIELNLVEHVFQNTVINNETIFSNIFRLKGHEYISVDLKEDEFKVCNIKQKKIGKSNLTLEEHVRNLTDRIKFTAKIITQNFNDITISMTGGLDSRVVLASYLNQGIKPNLVYGVGDSKLTNTCNEDLEINRLYENEFNLKFQKMNWGTSQPVDKCWKIYAKKYGFLSTIYGASEHVNEALENLENTEFIDFGYFGEPLRNIDWLENLSSDFFSIDVFIDDFYMNKNVVKFLNKSKYREFREHLLIKLTDICMMFELNPNKIHKDDFQLIHNEYRKGADTALTNFVNYSYYSINLLSTNIIESYVKSIDFSSKEKSQVILRVLNELYPQVLDVPIFSHCEMQVLNRKEFVLNPIPKNVIKKKVKYILEKSPGGDVIHDILSYIKRKKDGLFIGSHPTYSQSELKDFLFMKLSILNCEIVNKEVFSAGDIRHFSKYIQTLQIIDDIND